MLNLLPQQEKNTLKKEYSSRRIIVWLGAVCAVLLVSLVLLIPSYFLTKMRASTTETELAQAKSSLDAQMPSKEIVDQLQAAVRHAEILKPLTKPMSVYDLMKIFESKPREIKITSISFLQNDTGRPTISLGGRAVDRESLTSFARTLEARVEFATVDLPVSNFVKEKNIDFSMTITLK